MYYFQTVTTLSINKYAEMSLEETIDKLDIIGFGLFMLDDGWRSGDHFYISGGIIPDENLKQLCNRCKTFGLNDVHIVGNVRHDISVLHNDYIKNKRSIIKNNAIKFRYCN